MPEPINLQSGAVIQRELPPLTKLQLRGLLGQDSADVIEYALETSLTSESTIAAPPGGSLVDPTLSGVIVIGGSSDLVGFFGVQPNSQPTGADQAAAPAPVATTISYIGTPDQGGAILGDTGNMAINDQFATVAKHLNDLIGDVTALHTLTNRLRADLVSLGIIKGA